MLVFKEEESGEHASIRVLLEVCRDRWGPQIRGFSGLWWTGRAFSVVAMHRTGMNIHRALLRWLRRQLDLHVLPASQWSSDRHSVCSEIYQLDIFSLLPFPSVTGAPIKGKNPLEVHESWHHVLQWICWHCWGLLCKYTSLDFVQHKLCKYPFRDSSKCRLLDLPDVWRQ